MAVLTSTQTARPSARTKRHWWRRMRWCLPAPGQLRWAACQVVGVGDGEERVPSRLAGVRPSSSPSAGLQVITTPAG